MANCRVRSEKNLVIPHLSGWRNWIARPTTDREVAGSSPASDDFLLLFASKPRSSRTSRAGAFHPPLVWQVRLWSAMVGWSHPCPPLSTAEPLGCMRCLYSGLHDLLFASPRLASPRLASPRLASRSRRRIRAEAARCLEGRAHGHAAEATRCALANAEHPRAQRTRPGRP